MPTEWIDADTGHRVIRLSREDGTESLYFNQNAYTADGKKLIVTTASGGIATITLATRDVKPLVAGEHWRLTQVSAVFSLSIFCLGIGTIIGGNWLDAARDALIRQVTGAVRWIDCEQALKGAGANLFIEAGPGKVLCGLLKQIDPELKSLNVEDAGSLEKALAEINGAA